MVSVLDVVKRSVVAVVFVVALSYTFTAMPKTASADNCSDMADNIVNIEEDIQILRDSLGKEYVRLILALGPPVDPIIVEVIADIEAINNAIFFLQLDILILELARENTGCEP